MSANEGSSRFDRLSRALDAWLDYVDHGPTADAETFLRGVDPDLHEVLEPMLTVRPPTDRPAPDLAIAGFEIRREIGRGGMGVVFEAEDIALERRVALKVLGAAVSTSAGALARFRREAAAAARLHHPGIVEIYGFGESAGTHWIAMEFIAGTDLANRLRTPGPLGVSPGATRPAELAETVAQVAEALQYAHEQHVVHRDIKPHNVLVGADGRVCLVDFGLAKMLDREGLSRTGEFAGSLAYASPEQVEGATDVDARTDIWSLGVLLYEGLAGARPFDAETPQAMVRATLATDPRPPGGPRDLQTICLKALEKEPDRRYQTAGALAADLRRFLAHEPIDATPPSTLSRWMRFVRRRRLATAAAILLVGLAALVASLWVQGQQQESALADMSASATASLEQLETLLRRNAQTIDRRPIAEHRGRVEAFVQEAERLLALQPRDPNLQRIVARSNEDAARLYQLLQLEAEAFAAHERSITIAEQLLQEDPEDHAARSNLATTLHNRHVLRMALGQGEAAAADLTQAITHWQSVLEESKDPNLQSAATTRLAAALTNRARARIGSPAAAPDLEAAANLWQTLLEQRRLTAEEFAKHLDTSTTRARHDFLSGRADPAQRALDQVLAEFDRIPADSRGRGFRQVHTQALAVRGEIARQSGNKEEARTFLEASVAAANPLATHGSGDDVLTVTQAWFAMAAFLIDIESDLDTARTLIERGQRQLDAQLARAPNFRVARRERARFASLLATCQVLQRAPAAVVESAFRDAIRQHEILGSGGGEAWPTDLASALGAYARWLHDNARTAEALPLLARATKASEDALRTTPDSPILRRDLLSLYLHLLRCTDELGKGSDLLATAARMIRTLGPMPAAVRMALRSIDRAIRLHPAANRKAYAWELAPQALAWIEAADQAKSNWRRPGFTASLRVLPHHPEIGPLLSRPAPNKK